MTSTPPPLRSGRCSAPSTRGPSTPSPRTRSRLRTTSTRRSRPPCCTTGVAGTRSACRGRCSSRTSTLRPPRTTWTRGSRRGRTIPACAGCPGGTPAASTWSGDWRAPGATRPPGAESQPSSTACWPTGSSSGSSLPRPSSCPGRLTLGGTEPSGLSSGCTRRRAISSTRRSAPRSPPSRSSCATPAIRAGRTPRSSRTRPW
mmetsp:Transcript_22700/g.45955  ORF Transcript_22700/g.45955 Transcript_22700/m.45955 type:complete len:202 (+) Transcript_22700:414-1019(+)